MKAHVEFLDQQLSVMHSHPADATDSLFDYINTKVMRKEAAAFALKLIHHPVFEALAITSIRNLNKYGRDQKHIITEMMLRIPENKRKAVADQFLKLDLWKLYVVKGYEAQGILENIAKTLPGNQQLDFGLKALKNPLLMNVDNGFDLFLLLRWQIPFNSKPEDIFAYGRALTAHPLFERVQAPYAGMLTDEIGKYLKGKYNTAFNDWLYDAFIKGESRVVHQPMDDNGMVIAAVFNQAGAIEPKKGQPAALTAGISHYYGESLYVSSPKRMVDFSRSKKSYDDENSRDIMIGLKALREKLSSNVLEPHSLAEISILDQFMTAVSNRQRVVEAQESQKNRKALSWVTNLLPACLRAPA